MATLRFRNRRRPGHRKRRADDRSGPRPRSGDRTDHGRHHLPDRPGHPTVRTDAPGGALCGSCRRRGRRRRCRRAPDTCSRLAVGDPGTPRPLSSRPPTTPLPTTASSSSPPGGSSSAPTSSPPSRASSNASSIRSPRARGGSKVGVSAAWPPNTASGSSTSNTSTRCSKAADSTGFAWSSTAPTARPPPSRPRCTSGSAPKWWRSVASRTGPTSTPGAGPPRPNPSAARCSSTAPISAWHSTVMPTGCSRSTLLGGWSTGTSCSPCSHSIWPNGSCSPARPWWLRS